jgi:hypothetical protein
MAPSTFTVAELRDLGARMTSAPEGDLSEALAELGEWETLKHAIEGRQAMLAARVDVLMRERAALQGEPVVRQGRGVGEAVAAARRISPAQGRSVVAMAKHLHRLPALMERFARGDLSEHKATMLSREAAVLDSDDQRTFAEEIASAPDLAMMATRKLSQRAYTIATRLDAEATLRRRQHAVEDRYVRVRPTDRGDGMAWLTALLPVEQAYAVKESLVRAADVLLASGAATSRGQVMADTLVVRVTDGNADLGTREPSHPIRVNLIMTDTALLDRGSEPAIVSGHGPIPAAAARRMIRMADHDDQRIELRRLYTSPETGELVTMESRARLFPTALKDFIKLRDQLCRTPGCGAAIAHIDHIRDWAAGGPTSVANGQGLCARCNWAYQVIEKPATGPPALAPTPRGLRIDLLWQAA